MKTLNYIVKLITDISLWIQVPANEQRLVGMLEELERSADPWDRVVKAGEAFFAKLESF